MRPFLFLILVIVCGCKVVDFDNLSKSQIIKYQIEKIEILKKWPDGEELKFKVREYSPEGNMIIDSGINESYFRDFLILNSYNFRGQLTKSIYYDDDSSVYAIFLYQYYKNGKRKQVNEESGSEELRPKKRRFIKGIRPSSPEEDEDDILNEVEEHREFSLCIIRDFK